MSVVVRIPDDVHADVRAIASLRGRQPGALLAEAWRHYIDTHRDTLAAEFEEVGRLFRAGDIAGLAAYAGRSVETEAEELAAAAREAR